MKCMSTQLFWHLLAIGELCFAPSVAKAAIDSDDTEGIDYSLSTQMSASVGRHTPLWLNANKYGLSSLSKANGYMRATVELPSSADRNRKWDVGFGIDIAQAFHYTSSTVVQQAFVELRYLKGRLTLGSKEEPMELKNQRLSSGSQTLGINSRPVPSLRLALEDYWNVPGTKGWVSIKGHIAYGMTTDDGWQKDVTQMKSRYTEDTFFHTKAGYVKIGNEEQYFPFSVEAGLEMGAQIAGNAYWPMSDGTMRKIENDKSLTAFLQALVPGGGETTETTYRNATGNIVGSWVMRLNADYDTWNLGVYADHYFEDHSAMLFLDYDGYGTGAEWNERVKSRYTLYDLRDIMLGTELKLKDARYVNNIVVEYLYTKYQSGPLYHDHTQMMPDHVSGLDNYYNHHLYTGWQHWGQVIGNPLYLSPIYNNDGLIEVECNRFVAYHLGISGAPTDRFNYRFLASWQKGYGTFRKPYPNPKENFSAMFEANIFLGNHWHLCAAAAIDRGALRGNNSGLQLTLVNKGLLNKKQKR